LNKRAVLLISGVVLLIAAIVTAVIIVRTRPSRHPVFRRAHVAAAPVKGIPPVEQWTDAFAQLPPADLARLLDQIAAQHPDLYAKYSLGYLHARVLLEENEPKLAAQKLAPFLAKGNAFRDLALYHLSEI